MMLPKNLEISHPGVLLAYQDALSERGYMADPHQMVAVQRLQQLFDELLVFKAARRGKLRKLLFRPALPKSVYLWGGVGRGKSFLMDCYFAAVPYVRKRRVHFHAFMQEVQDALQKLNHTEDPLQQVAQNISQSTRLLCFDEFHVSDIADAMILGRLLQALFDRGVIFVMTSNYPPEGLYPNGLQRINFLPTIDMLKARFDVLEIDAGVDYRLRALTAADVFMVPAGEQADIKLMQIFEQLNQEPGQADVSISLLGRSVQAKCQGDRAIWFTFEQLCQTARSQNDYLVLAQTYQTLIVSDIPQMQLRDAAAARRFTWLIDVLYDFRVKLVVSANVPAECLYLEGPHLNEFARTVSRLQEMRSHSYLEENHRLLDLNQ